MEGFGNVEKCYALCRPDEGCRGPVVMPALIGVGRAKDPRILCLEFRLGEGLFVCGDQFDDWAIVESAEPGRTCDVWSAVEGDEVELVERVCSIALAREARARELNAVMAGTAVGGVTTVDDLVDLWGPSGSDEIDPEFFEAAASRIGLDEVAALGEQDLHDGEGGAAVFPDATGVEDDMVGGDGEDESHGAAPEEEQGVRATPGEGDELVVEGEPVPGSGDDGVVDGVAIPVRADGEDRSEPLEVLSGTESAEALEGVSTRIGDPDPDRDPVLGALSSAPGG